MEDVTRKLAQNVINTRYEDIDAAIIENAKNRIIDVVGCAIGGSRAPGNEELIRIVTAWGGSEEASVLVHGVKVPVLNAAMVNCVMARSYDFESLLPEFEERRIPGHISGTSVMTALTLGDANRASGREFLTALVVGEDVAVRVLSGSQYNLLHGWDCTGTVNAIGATAIAGRLMELTEDQMMNAFGMVVNQLGGTFQIIGDKTTFFKLPQGLSARNAIFSAQLAKAGWTGPKDPFTGKWGYYDMYTDGCTNPENLTKDLGKVFFSEHTIKPYSCCRGIHPTIDCILAITSGNDFNIEDISDIVVYISEYASQTFFAQPFEIGSYPLANGLFSIYYGAAAALKHKSVKPEHFTTENIMDPSIMELTKKIKLEGHKGLGQLASRVEITLKNGKKFTELRDKPLGGRTNPMTREQIKEKFRTNVRFSKGLQEEKAANVLTLIEKVETMSDVRDIANMAVASE